MPEEINGRKIFSLYKVTRSIQKTIADRYKTSYWIKAEMNKLNLYKQSGHCYPELVEKEGGRVIAQIRATLWKDDYTKINSSFMRLINEPIKDGIKILFLATISFHPEYGLSLRILDIDPNFTLGDLEKEKQETIKKLQTEEIFRRNKTLKISLLPQRIAVISVQTSKGYADFIKVLEAAEETWDYKYFHLLFPSLLQSDKAVQSIINQLKRIRNVINYFDVVAIVRGGGGDIGLSCYNKYDLAKEIALFPIPVITGIGHATNETVVEMVAFENAITPTKLAEFLIQKFHNFSVPIQKAEEKIIDKARKLILEEKSKFQAEVKLFRSVTNNMLLKSKNSLESISQSTIRGTATFCNTEKLNLIHLGQNIKKDTFNNLKRLSLLLDQFKQRVISSSRTIFRSQSLELVNIEKNINNMSPNNVLKRGYSITLLDGKSVTSYNKAKQGDILETILLEGKIISTVNSSSKSSEL